MRVYLSLGSNIGNREGNLRQAVAALQACPGVRVLAVSSLYETDPVGYACQARFGNIAAAAEVSLTPEALLGAVKQMEREMGREASFRWGPRLIDIDILLYGDRRIETAELVIPHPRLTERGFVLIPLAEIAPDLRLPDGQSVRALAEQPGMADGVRFWGKWQGRLAGSIDSKGGK